MPTSSRSPLRAALVAASLLATACAASAPAVRPAAPRASLYDRLGGKEAISAVVGEMLRRIAADGAINARFANSDLGHLKQALVDQICQVSGGPCQYAGKDMRAAHTGMKIADAEFTAMVGDLKGALDQLKVGATEQQELLGALAGMQGDVVGQ